ncbi:hypothetical protein NKI15_02835 [Mesorhizobium sp. M0862]|uniref:hypothetical protein n=1 Tax=Mesorhizobium sp. M0862 TaxID=2957015 RepID=UPI003338189C
MTYSAKVFFEKTSDPLWRYHSKHFEALDVRPGVDDLDEYGIDQAGAEKLTLVIDPKNVTITAAPGES